MVAGEAGKRDLILTQRSVSRSSEKENDLSQGAGCLRIQLCQICIKFIFIFWNTSLDMLGPTYHKARGICYRTEP